MSSRRARERRRNKQVIGIILLCSVAAAVISGVVYKLTHKTTILDSNYCPESIQSTTAVVFDATDPLSAVQMRATENELQKIERNIPRYGRLQLFVVVSDLGNKLLVPVMSICNPGTRDDADTLKESPKIVSLLHRKYREVMTQALAGLDHDSHLSASPIIETLQSVAVTGFGDVAEGADKRLVLVSDLLQNSSRLSVYRERPLSIEVARRPDLSAQLDGVSVSVLLLDRPQSSISALGLVRFWEAYFQSSGAAWNADIAVKRIAG